MKLLALLALLLSGCGYLEGTPERTWFEYEETSTNCAKVMEFPDRIVILYIPCDRAPDTIKRVKYFGGGGRRWRLMK